MRLAQVGRLRKLRDKITPAPTYPNARAIVNDLEDPAVGVCVFDRFTAGRDGTLRYYHSVAAIFLKRGTKPARALDATVARMHELAGTKARVVLD